MVQQILLVTTLVHSDKAGERHRLVTEESGGRAMLKLRIPVYNPSRFLNSDVAKFAATSSEAEPPVLVSLLREPTSCHFLLSLGTDGPSK